MPYNLSSPNGIVEPCELKDLPAWFAREVVQVSATAERNVLLQVSSDLGAFVRWAERPILLWPTCNRVPEKGSKQKYFSYPPHIKQMAKDDGLKLDTRPNGPAIAAFRLAGGERPQRFGSSNAWSIHHLYSGKFPYFGREQTTHATKDVKHFTQSAGLIAAHPVADALVDEFPFFAWFLRAHAFLKFGYDPDGVFAQSSDDFGFKKGTQHSVIALPPNGTLQVAPRKSQHVVQAPRPPRVAGRERSAATIPIRRFADALHSVIPQPCYGRPFVCDGLAEECVAIVIGENPATKVGSVLSDWWSYWNDATGFQYSKWRKDYDKARGERGAASTRLRLDRLRTRGVRCLETNVFANERPDGAGAGASNRDLLDIALETLPNIRFVVAHGNPAKEYVRSRSFPSHIRKLFELRHFRSESYANIDLVANEILAD